MCSQKETMQRFNERLRLSRIKAGLSQAEVGQALNPPRGRRNVSEWERAQHEPSISHIEQLAAALGVSPCWLAWEIEHGK